MGAHPFSLPLLSLAIVMIGAVSGQVRYSSDLNCDFTHPCRWTNSSGLPETMGWSLTTDHPLVPDDRFPMSDGRKVNSFVYTTSPPGRHQISLVSDVVDCQLGGARLKFFYYFTGMSSTLEACLRFPPGSMDPTHLHCYDPGSNARGQQWTLGSVELPPMSTPMEILLRATFEAPNDLVAIDDITFEAILCETSHQGASEGGGGRIDEGEGDALEEKIAQIMAPSRHRQTEHRQRPQSPPPLIDLDAPPSNCGLDCTFDGGDLCAYKNVPGSSLNLREWKLTRGPASNPLTGIYQDVGGDGLFAYAGDTGSAEHTFILQAGVDDGKRVLLTSGENVTLHFQYYLAGVHGRLRVCLGDALPSLNGGMGDDTDLLKEDEDPTPSSPSTPSTNCPFEQSGANMFRDSRQWRHGSITLPSIPASLPTISFVVDQLAANYIIGVDEIHLVEGGGDEEGQQRPPPVRCTSTEGTGSKLNSNPSTGAEGHFH